ncbi:MAG: secretin N-terminal domain-containing protein [Planctomycetota bacterium]|jgi:type IV pilus assembly protein PilQ
MYCYEKSIKGLKIGRGLLIFSFLLLIMSAGATDEVQPIEINSVDATIQSITFKEDMKIRDALRFLSAKYKKNIVPSGSVSGMVTVSSLYEVTFEEALDAILGNDLKYVEKDNFINVYTNQEYKMIQEDIARLTYKFFTLYYIKADDAKQLITPLLSPKGKIESTKPAETGVPTGQSISSGSGGGDTMSLSDAILVYDYPENIDKVAELISRIDIRPRQVLIEATILSAALTENTQLGIDWQTFRGTPLTDVSGITRTSPDGYEFAGSSPVSIAGGLAVGLATGDIASFIKAVETVTDTTVIANPKILAVNKQLGEVYIGTKLAYKTQTTQTDTSTTETVGFLDTGTKLSFRPFIGDDGYIRMDIHPKDSTGELNAQQLPDETSAELKTNIMVKDGQTIVLGGLFRDKITTTKTQIPILGDLPIIGVLFRGSTDKSERQEVIILLTPHIIDDSEGKDLAEKRVDDIERKRFGAKDNLQLISKIKRAEEHYASAAKAYSKGQYKRAMWEVNWAIQIRPTYLEAVRLKERMLEENKPEAFENLDRNVLGKVERKDTKHWMRR